MSKQEKLDQQQKIKDRKAALKRIVNETKNAPHSQKIWDTKHIVSASAKDRLMTNIQIRDQRGKWSGWLLRLIIFTTGSLTLIVYLLGFGVLNLSESVMKYIIIEGLVRVFALASIVVGFLFHEGATTMLNTEKPNPPMPQTTPPQWPRMGTGGAQKHDV
jgi:hypothetical protein